MPRKITCTIIAKNEEDRISECLRSVIGLVDEIVVIDSGSSDRTVAISESFGAKCFHRDWQGFGPQKRFAEEKATNDWILNIDADEWLTEELREEIKSLARAEPRKKIIGYRIKIKNVYPGMDKPRIFADQHQYVRLYNKNFCRFPNSAVFDEICLPSSCVARLKSPMYHRSIRSISHLIDKNIAYYKMQSFEKKKSKLAFPFRLAFEPFVAFTKYYIFRRHITGGCYGFLIAATIAALRTYRLLTITFPRQSLQYEMNKSCERVPRDSTARS